MYIIVVAQFISTIYTYKAVMKFVITITVIVILNQFFILK